MHVQNHALKIADALVTNNNSIKLVYTVLVIRDPFT